MKKPSVYLQAALIVCQHEAMHCLRPLISLEPEGIEWSKLNYSALSGGQKVMVSWVYVLFTAEPVPAAWRDPLVDFGVLDPTAQELVMKAVKVRFEMGGVS